MKRLAQKLLQKMDPNVSIHRVEATAEQLSITNEKRKEDLYTQVNELKVLYSEFSSLIPSLVAQTVQIQLSQKVEAALEERQSSYLDGIKAVLLMSIQEEVKKELKANVSSSITQSVPTYVSSAQPYGAYGPNYVTTDTHEELKKQVESLKQQIAGISKKEKKEDGAPDLSTRSEYEQLKLQLETLQNQLSSQKKEQPKERKFSKSDPALLLSKYVKKEEHEDLKRQFQELTEKVNAQIHEKEQHKLEEAKHTEEIKRIEESCTMTHEQINLKIDTKEAALSEAVNILRQELQAASTLISELQKKQDTFESSLGNNQRQIGTLETKLGTISSLSVSASASASGTASLSPSKSGAAAADSAVSASPSLLNPEASFPQDRKIAPKKPPGLSRDFVASKLTETSSVNAEVTAASGEIKTLLEELKKTKESLQTALTTAQKESAEIGIDAVQKLQSDIKLTKIELNTGLDNLQQRLTALKAGAKQAFDQLKISGGIVSEATAFLTSLLETKSRITELQQLKTTFDQQYDEYKKETQPFSDKMPQHITDMKTNKQTIESTLAKSSALVTDATTTLKETETKSAEKRAELETKFKSLEEKNGELKQKMEELIKLEGETKKTITATEGLIRTNKTRKDELTKDTELVDNALKDGVRKKTLELNKEVDTLQGIYRGTLEELNKNKQVFGASIQASMASFSAELSALIAQKLEEAKLVASRFEQQLQIQAPKVFQDLISNVAEVSTLLQTTIRTTQETVRAQAAAEFTRLKGELEARVLELERQVKRREGKLPDASEPPSSASVKRRRAEGSTETAALKKTKPKDPEDDV